MKGYQLAVTKQFNRGEISEAVRQENRKRIQNANAALNQYMKYYGNKFKTTKGSGIRKQKGGNVLFFNNPKQLPKKLELIRPHCW